MSDKHRQRRNDGEGPGVSGRPGHRLGHHVQHGHRVDDGYGRRRPVNDGDRIDNREGNNRRRRKSPSPRRYIERDGREWGRRDGRYGDDQKDTYDAGVKDDDIVAESLQDLYVVCCCVFCDGSFI